MDKEPLLNQNRTVRYDKKGRPPLLKEELDAVVTDKTVKHHVTWELCLTISACIIGSAFPMGYNIGVVNAPTAVIQSFYNETYHERYGKEVLENGSLHFHNETWYLSTGYMSSSTITILWAFTATANAIGAAFGILPTGYLSNKYGRKTTLLWNNLVNLIGTLLMVFAKYAKSYEMFISGRLINGFSCGLSSVLGPIFISEIAPVTLRGFIGTFIQVAITTGILVSNILGLEQVLGSEDLWPFLFAVNGVCIVWQVLTLSCCPDTPRYLMLHKNDEDEAEKSLKWLRGRVDVSAELDEMISEKELLASCPKFTLTDLFKQKYLRIPLSIGVVLHLTQQFCGINAVTYYSTPIFEDAGLSSSAAQYGTMGSGAVNLLMAFLSAFIIERAGRRKLQLTGVMGLFICSLTLCISIVLHKKYGYQWISYISVVAVMFFMISFSLGPGGMPWIIVAELFPQGPRASAVSVCTMTNTLSSIIVGVVFPLLNNQLIHEYSFLPFAILLLFFWIFSYFKMPETKGKTIEEITSYFQLLANGDGKLAIQDKTYSKDRTDIESIE